MSKGKAVLTDYEEITLEDVRNQKVYCNIVKVSSSGMTRKMRFYAISKQDCDLRHMTHLVGKITGYSTDKNHDLVVKGCGMDMIFHVLSNFNYAMAQRDTGKNIQELLETQECGERIYDDYFFNANRYGTL